MNRDISARVIKEAEYILDCECTVREAAAYFGISKSTLHSDISVKLKNLDLELYKKIHRIMDYHFGIRHIRGGEATRKRFKGN